jgi:sec-independent protein translocase protein TatA
MFGSFGWMELLLILFIVLIIFGAGKIPQLGEGLGKAIKGFKKSVNEPDAIDVTAAPSSQDQPAQQPPPPSWGQSQTQQNQAGVEPKEQRQPEQPKQG